VAGGQSTTNRARPVLPVAVADDEPEPVGPIAEIHDQWAARMRPIAPGSDAVAEAEQLALDASMPQPGFSRASRSTRSRGSSLLRGRPGRFGYVQ
jgi:hypothetical protein